MGGLLRIPTTVLAMVLREQQLVVKVLGGGPWMPGRLGNGGPQALSSGLANDGKKQIQRHALLPRRQQTEDPDGHLHLPPVVRSRYCTIYTPPRPLPP